MALIMWNARGICSTERQNEFKRICAENSVEIFGVVVTKTKKERFDEARDRMGSEWSMFRNEGGEGRDSIWVGCKAHQWSILILREHNQLIHARLLNTGGIYL